MITVNNLIICFLFLTNGYSESHPDSLLLNTQSKFGLWLDRVTAPELIIPFWESTILFLVGLIFAYFFYKRSINMQKKDHLQTRALLLASLALLIISTKGLFFLVGSLSLINLLPQAIFSNVYWLGWQFSLLWFLCFAYLFALSFIRSKKSYDIYFITSFIFFFTFLTIFYNDTLINKSFFKLTSESASNSNGAIVWSPEHLLDKSTFLSYALNIHIIIWIYLFLSMAMFLYKKSKRYQDESARRASFILTAAFSIIGILGVVNLILLQQKSSLFTSQSYLIAILITCLFYYGVQNMYRHGRYKRF